ncbi:DsrE family protein [Pseudoalteromonas sp. OOF1S-7]|uniref:DsrE family protein n=1 Tax=Pseudoalteromonas sp. OOF1S-7 TaxID=2917757 RepID=UPI001EF66454|nr:DsrE family protein [Pseudoalteromonas sp. OOF1S-7]MCG7536683.1 DsrE family protein [Pseudoalteromonas sp. OOF1S-7]
MCDTHIHACQHKPTKDEEAHSIFLGLMGSPFANDGTTSVFRMAESILSQGKEVVIWTCGNSTAITQTTSIRTQDPIKSRLDEQGNYPMYELAKSLFAKYPDQLRWYVCQYCMEERGATNQIEEVEVLLPFSFNFYLNQSDQALVLGTK